jgi:hypothetical protein
VAGAPGFAQRQLRGGTHGAAMLNGEQQRLWLDSASASGDPTEESDDVLRTRAVGGRLLNAANRRCDGHRPAQPIGWRRRLTLSQTGEPQSAAIKGLKTNPEISFSCGKNSYKGN